MTVVFLKMEIFIFILARFKRKGKWFFKSIVVRWFFERCTRYRWSWMGKFTRKTKGGCGHAKSCTHRGATISRQLENEKKKMRNNDQITRIMEKQATNPRVTSFLVSPWNTRLGIPEYQKGSIIYSALIRIQQRNEIKQFFHLTFTSLYPRIIFHFVLSFRKRRKTLSFSSFIQLFRYINWSLKNCFDDVPYDYPRILIVLDVTDPSNQLTPPSPQSFSSIPTKRRENLEPN